MMVPGGGSILYLYRRDKQTYMVCMRVHIGIYIKVKTVGTSLLGYLNINGSG